MVTQPFELVRGTGVIITHPLTRTWNWDHDTTHTNAARMTWVRSTAEYI